MAWFDVRCSRDLAKDANGTSKKEQKVSVPEINYNVNQTTSFISSIFIALIDRILSLNSSFGIKDRFLTLVL